MYIVEVFYQNVCGANSSTALKNFKRRRYTCGVVHVYTCIL